MKRKILFATIGVMFGMLSVFPINSSAENEPSLVINSTESELKSLFDDYAEKNYQDFLMAMLLNEDEANIEKEYILGTPFTIAQKEKTNEKFNYPVIGKESGKIRYVLEISDFKGRLENESPSAVISVELANVLEELKGTENKPVTLGYANGDLYASESDNGTDSQLLKESPIKLEKNNKVNIEDVIQDETNSGTKPIEIENEIDDISVADIPTPEYYKNVQTNSRKLHQSPTYSVIQEYIYEQQTDKSWCGAYSISGAINFKEERKVYTGENVMKYLFPNMPTTELNDRGTTMPELIKFAKYAGYGKAKYANRIFSVTEVRNQINQQNPLVIFMQNQLPSKYEWHASVINGWMKSAGEEFFYIWNPWYRRTQVVNVNGMRFWSQDNDNFMFNWRMTLYDISK
ncbi:C47 family peptidase [Vagococcus fluvialis]|uniref:Staphopain proregion domain-containing protein n=1 Tax=Vagococcus fluvialis TaxID=2738 RepID=A0A7X6D9V1_9ENTE|nr:C47 family peptidase [Vagococcus fluvialis]NKC68457.1 hypothetical protein [Vagococcus fluvialis]